MTQNYLYNTNREFFFYKTEKYRLKVITNIFLLTFNTQWGMLFLIDWETDLRNSKYEQYNMTIANIKIDQNTLQAKKKPLYKVKLLH